MQPYLFVETDHVRGLVWLSIGSSKQGIEVADVSQAITTELQVVGCQARTSIA